MPLQSSGQISIGDIRTELSSSSGSLRALSSAAGKSSPDAMSEFYGYTSASPPDADTGHAASISQTYFRPYGYIFGDGGATITEYGFYVGTNGSSPTANTKYVASNWNGSIGGSFNRLITGLTAGTLYYFWGYATNSAGTDYGPQNSVYTSPPTIPYTLSGSTNQDEYFAGGRFGAYQFPTWGATSQWTLSSTNTLGTNVTFYAFLQSNSYGFAIGNGGTASWSGSYAGGSANFPYFTAPNNTNPSLAVISKTKSFDYTIVPAGLIIRLYVQISAAGYGARNTVVQNAIWS